jgi:hypothetical protein
MPDAEIYQFGEFSSYVQDRRLTRSGQAIALLPKALDADSAGPGRGAW